MNYRPTKGPVAAEAFPFAMPLAALVIILFALPLGGFWNSVAVLSMMLLVFVLAFFRNPERYYKETPGAVLSGADGKVTAAGLIPNPNFPGGQCLRIAVFMSVFDCHINWAPVTGKVLNSAHFPGKFINAAHDKSADENERKILAMESDTGHRVEIKLVAGMIARRIVCPIDEGDSLHQGEKIGLIRFGSRVEIIVPADSALHVRPGMMIKGSETVIATLPVAAKGPID